MGCDYCGKKEQVYRMDVMSHFGDRMGIFCETCVKGIDGMLRELKFVPMEKPDEDDMDHVADDYM